MCESLVIVDRIKLNYKVHQNFACDYSTDRRICVLSDRGVYVLELCGWTWPRNVVPDVLVKKKFCHCSSYKISANIGLDLQRFLLELPQDLMYEAILTTDISSTLEHTTPVQQQPIKAQWSSSALLGNIPSVLAVLTNLGVLELFWRKIDFYGGESYSSINNVTQLGINVFSTNWINSNIISPEEQYSELVRRIRQVRPTTFTWGHIYEEDEIFYSYFFVSHLDGGISVWKLKHSHYNSNNEPFLVLCSYFKSALPHITALYWLPARDEGLLFCGNIEGKISLISISGLPEVVEFIEEIIYPEVDNIKIELIKLVSYNDLTYLFVVKGNCLIIGVLNKDYEMVSQAAFNSGNIVITGIEHYERNIVLVLTYTGVFQQLQLEFENDELRIVTKKINLELKWRKYRTHGLILSPNRVFVGVLIHPCMLKHWHKKVHYTKLVILKNEVKKPLELLLQNPSGLLTNYWDCFEMLRVSGMVEKRYPCANYPFILKTNYDMLSFPELKTLLHVTRITDLIRKIKVIDRNRNIEPTVIYNKVVQMKMAIRRMSQMIKLYVEGEQLSDFQFNSLETTVYYLKEILGRDHIVKFGLGENTIDELYELFTIAYNIEYPPMPVCYWCQNVLIGLSCDPQHYDVRCHVSFMPIIGVPGYKCQFCLCTVHGEVSKEVEHVMCPYCDIPMDFYSFFEEEHAEDANILKQSEESCDHDDCLKTKLSETSWPDEATHDLDFDQDLIRKCAPNWDEISVSDVSDDAYIDENDTDYIFERDLGELVPALKKVAVAKDLKKPKMYSFDPKDVIKF